MKLVIIESPYAGDIGANIAYALACIKDSLDQGEAPYASHILYSTVLDDKIKEERNRGIVAGYSWMAKADLVAVYKDHGISLGMKQAIEHAKLLNKPIEYREILDHVSQGQD
jgi:hypothetical protein